MTSRSSYFSRRSRAPPPLELAVKPDSACASVIVSTSDAPSIVSPPSSVPAADLPVAQMSLAAGSAKMNTSNHAKSRHQRPSTPRIGLDSSFSPPLLASFVPTSIASDSVSTRPAFGQSSLSCSLTGTFETGYRSVANRPGTAPANVQTASSTAAMNSGTAPPPLPAIVLVEALHDWISEDPTYLIFKKGQTIRVFNKAPSGWWDGEILADGKRGWFPSNYVTGISPSKAARVMSAHKQPDQNPPPDGDLATSSHKSTVSCGSSSLSSASSCETNSRSSPSSIALQAGPSSQQFSQKEVNQVLDPIVHAVSLLFDAATAGRTSHFRPSTSCVNTSVRSMLSIMDCFNKESDSMRKYPSLARARKKIHQTQHKMVAHQEKASAKTTDESTRELEIENMLSMARKLLSDVEQFLRTAADCGIKIPERRKSESFISASEDEEIKEGPHIVAQTNRNTGEGFSGQQSALRIGLPAKISWQPSFTQERPELLSTRTQSILSGSFRGRSRSLGQTSSASGLILNEEETRQPAVSLLSLFAPVSSPAPPSRFNSISSTSSSSFSLESSKNSSQALASAPVSASGFFLAANIITQVLSLHEEVVTSLAALIGHTHFHSIRNYPSNQAHLLEATQTCLDKATSLLSLILSIASSPEVQRKRPMGDVRNLHESGNRLSYAVDHLIASARKPLPSSSSSADADVDDTEEVGQKVALLHAVTEAVESAGLCKNLAEQCVAPLVQDKQAVWILVKSCLPWIETSAVKNKGSEIEPFEGALSEQQQSSDLGKIKAIDEKAQEETVVGKAVSAWNSQCTINPSAFDSVGLGIVGIIKDSNEGRAQSSLLMTPIRPRSSSLSHVRFKERDHYGDYDQIPSMPSLRSMSVIDTTSLDSTLSTPRVSFDSPHRPPLIRIESSQSPPRLLDVSCPDVSFRQYHASTASAKLNTPTGVLRSRSLTTVATQSTRTSVRYVERNETGPADFVLNPEGQIIGATLPDLVDKLISNSSTVGSELAQVFFLTFRMFTTPQELVSLLLHRFDMKRPSLDSLESEENQQSSQTQNVVLIRLRILLFLKAWLDTHWRNEVDHVVLPNLHAFARGVFNPALSSHALQVMASVEFRSSSPEYKGQRLASTSTQQPSSIDSPPEDLVPPPPLLVSRSLFHYLKSNNPTIQVTDFDPLELARQLTLMEFGLFKQVRMKDLLEFGKNTSPALVAMSTFHTQVTGYISEAILNEADAKKRATVVKYFIKLATRLTDVQNFSAAYAILGAFNSASVARLKKTFEALSTKTKDSLAVLQDLFNVSRNSINYRTRLRETVPPALPYLGAVLSDLTMCAEGNPATRPAPYSSSRPLINLAKYHALWRIISAVEPYQTPFTFIEVPEIQVFLSKSLAKKELDDPIDLYERSLRLEPR
ncbi:Ras1 guanine nucleotide exchange factor [Phaffia rhodozyma]|uniref:Ras1 guanine nucleotide exchange factor n=1 Tax=Phaffia rhodozyma TaxID=264483 RepID=A0A0F7STT6_PHARH|nr:Ras1 guanine nucleotide exchange factor [Phaffia rhodozyma]